MGIIGDVGSRRELRTWAAGGSYAKAAMYNAHGQLLWAMHMGSGREQGFSQVCGMNDHE